MSHPNHQIARDFFAAFFRGELTDELFTPDAKVWTTLGPLDKAAYRATVATVMSLFVGGAGKFAYTIDAITAEDDRVVVENKLKGAFPDGEPYENTYIFSLKVRDGRVAAIAEHFNPVPFFEQMAPRMQPAAVPTPV